MQTIDPNPLAGIQLPSVMIGNLLPLTFLLFLIIYIGYSAVLVYHWRAYGTDFRVTALTLLIYFGSTIPLVFIMSAIASA